MPHTKLQQTQPRRGQRRGLTAQQLQHLGLPRVYGLVHMLAHAGGVVGCVACQHYPFSARSQGARS